MSYTLMCCLVPGLPPVAWLSRTFGGAQGQRGAATSWSAAPLSIFRAAPIANWQQEAALPKTAFASNGITALGLIPFHQKCGRAFGVENSATNPGTLERRA